MKPLYDRYRLVKQILCRASTIPVIVSTGVFNLLFAQHPPPPPRPPPLCSRVQTLTGDVILGSHWL